MSAVTFPFPANWAAEVVETEEDLTSVLGAWDGTEQRMALRSCPIRTLEYSLLTTETAELAFLQNLLAAPRSREWGVPWWPDASDLASTLASGSTVVPVQTSGRSYVAGQQVLFHDRASQFEAKTVLSVGADSVTLTSPTTTTWPAGSLVMPVRSGQLVDDFDIDHLTDTAAELRVKFDCRNLDEAPAGSMANTYLGFPVLEYIPEPGTKRKLVRLANVIDSKTGARSIDDRRLHPVPVHQLQFVGLARAGVDALRGALRSLRGQVDPCWLPSGRADLVLHAAAGAGASVIQVKTCGYTDYAWPVSCLRDIQIQAYDGTTQWRRITGATTASGYEALNLSAPLASAVAPGSCLLSYLSLCRRASDVLTTTWHSTEVATLAVDMTDLPWEVPA